MQYFSRISLKVCSFLVPLSGCAPKAALAPVVVNVGATSWQTDTFFVNFNAGERLPGKKHSSSLYEVVSRTSKKKLFVQSAHSTHGFESASDYPTNYVKIIPDTNGTALLIEEIIPNDCSPCSNYIWIRSNTTSEMEHSYLQLPTTTNSGVGEPEEEYYPTIISLTNGILKYKFPNGKVTTANAIKIQSLDEPTPPG